MLETDPATFDSASGLDPWDSLAVVSTIAIIDDVYGRQVSGRALTACVTAGDVLKLVNE